MGRLPDNQRRYEIQEIQVQHRSIIDMLFAGHSNVEIAETLGITTATVSNVRNSTLVREQLARMTAQADADAIQTRKRIAALADTCIDTVVEVMEKGISESARLRAAEMLLDRGGFSVPKEQSVHNHLHLTSNDVETLKERARARKQQLVVETDAIVTTGA